MFFSFRTYQRFCLSCLSVFLREFQKPFRNTKRYWLKYVPWSKKRWSYQSVYMSNVFVVNNENLADNLNTWYHIKTTRKRSFLLLKCWLFFFCTKNRGTLLYLAFCIAEVEKVGVLYHQRWWSRFFQSPRWTETFRSKKQNLVLQYWCDGSASGDLKQQCM